MTASDRICPVVGSLRRYFAAIPSTIIRRSVSLMQNIVNGGACGTSQFYLLYQCKLAATSRDFTTWVQVHLEVHLIKLGWTGVIFCLLARRKYYSSQVSTSGSIYLKFSVQHMVPVQKFLFKIMQKFTVLLQYYRNKSSHLLNRNILCRTLLSDTASEPHEEVITFLIASESKPQCGAWKTDLNVISSIMKHSHWRQIYTRNVYYVAPQAAKCT